MYEQFKCNICMCMKELLLKAKNRVVQRKNMHIIYIQQYKPMHTKYHNKYRLIEARRLLCILVWTVVIKVCINSGYKLVFHIIRSACDKKSDINKTP